MKFLPLVIIMIKYGHIINNCMKFSKLLSIPVIIKHNIEIFL